MNFTYDNELKIITGEIDSLCKYFRNIFLKFSFLPTIAIKKKPKMFTLKIFINFIITEYF